MLEVLAHEVGSVIGDDGIGHAKPVDDVQEELDNLLGINRSDWFCLCPFGELVDCDK